MNKLKITTIFFLLFSFLLALTGCVKDGIVPPADYEFPELAERHKPRYRFLLSSPYRIKAFASAPDGPYGFRVGWRDGCDTAASYIYLNTYRSVIKPRKDYIFMEKDKDYSLGWTTALWYCGRYFEVYQQRFENKYSGWI